MNPIIKNVFLNRWAWKTTIILLAVVAGLSGLLTPYYQKNFLLRQSFYDLMFAAVLMLISFLAYQLTLYFSQNESVIAQRSLSKMLYKHILTLNSFAKMNKSTGELVNHYTSDVPSATMWLEQTLPYILTTFLPLIFTPIFLKLTYQVPLSYSLICIIVILTFNYLMAHRQSLFFFTFKKLAAERMTIVNEWIQNIKNLRTLGWIPAFEEKIYQKRVLETENRVAMVTNGQTMNAFSSNITYWLNVLIIIYFLTTTIESLKKEDILVLIWVVGVFLSRPLRQLPWLLTIFFDGLTSVRRLHKILSLKNTLPIYPIGHFDIKDKNTLVKIKNLNLTLENHHLLKSIYLEIKPAEIVALIGPVGSGKSLLLKSLIEETPFTADYFSIEKISYLPQDPFIFSSTVHNNLSFSYDEFYDENAALNSIEMGRFDEASKTGKGLLEMVVGERGINLSGGQKQRLHISRLFHQPQPLFLLDDPFSAVDIKTEMALIESIKTMRMKNHAFLISTQRHSFLQHVDRVIYMENGRIIFNGTYDEFKQSPYEK